MDWPQDPLLLLGFTLLGVICFAALGVAFSHAIPNEESAPAYTNAIFLPLIFISGVFYSADDLPQALKAVAEALPLKHLIDGLSAGIVGGGGDTGTAALVVGGLGGGRAIPRRALLPLGVGAANAVARSHASCSRQRGEREPSRRQKRSEWSCTSRWATSCSTT